MTRFVPRRSALVTFAAVLEYAAIAIIFTLGLLLFIYNPTLFQPVVGE